MGRPRCTKCGRYASDRDVGSIYVDANGIDTVVDVVRCSRDGLQEVSWY